MPGKLCLVLGLVKHRIYSKNRSIETSISSLLILIGALEYVKYS